MRGLPKAGALACIRSLLTTPLYTPGSEHQPPQDPQTPKPGALASTPAVGLSPKLE